MKCKRCAIDLAHKNKRLRVERDGFFYCQPCHKIFTVGPNSAIIEDSIIIDISRTTDNSDICIFGCENPVELKTLPQTSRTQVFIDRGIIVPITACACSIHFDANEKFDLEILSNLQPSAQQTSLKSSEILSLLNEMRNVIIKKQGISKYVSGVPMGTGFVNIYQSLESLNLELGKSSWVGPIPKEESSLF